MERVEEVDEWITTAASVAKFGLDEVRELMREVLLDPRSHKLSPWVGRELQRIDEGQTRLVVPWFKSALYRILRAQKIAARTGVTLASPKKGGRRFGKIFKPGKEYPDWMNDPSLLPKKPPGRTK